MQELRHQLNRAFGGPRLLVQRLSALLARLDPKSIDTQFFLLAMAETDPDFLTRLDPFEAGGERRVAATQELRRI